MVRPRLHIGDLSAFIKHFNEPSGYLDRLLHGQVPHVRELYPSEFLAAIAAQLRIADPIPQNSDIPKPSKALYTTQKGCSSHPSVNMPLGWTYLSFRDLESDDTIYHNHTM